jgi:hypothetical protein
MISKLGIVVLLFFVFSDSDKRTAHYCPQAETSSAGQRAAPKLLSPQSPKSGDSGKSNLGSAL